MYCWQESIKKTMETSFCGDLSWTPHQVLASRVGVAKTITIYQKSHPSVSVHSCLIGESFGLQIDIPKSLEF